MNPISLDRVTIVSSLIRFTCLTQSHLLLKDRPKKGLRSQKSIFIMKMMVQVSDGTNNSPAVSK